MSIYHDYTYQVLSEQRFQDLRAEAQADRLAREALAARIPRTRKIRRHGWLFSGAHGATN